MLCAFSGRRHKTKLCFVNRPQPRGDVLWRAVCCLKGSKIRRCQAHNMLVTKKERRTVGRSASSCTGRSSAKGCVSSESDVVSWGGQHHSSSSRRHLQTTAKTASNRFHCKAVEDNGAKCMQMRGEKSVTRRPACAIGGRMVSYLFSLK